jgi:HEPN domain-containing protein
LIKPEYIDYWKVTAQKDWVAVQHLCEKGDYLQSLFFAHLVIEKLAKAHFVKDNPSDFPPKTHNLLILVAQTLLEPDEEQTKLLSRINQFQLDGRYPDYKQNMYKIASKTYTEEILIEIESIKTWLETTLP